MIYFYKYDRVFYSITYEVLLLDYLRANGSFV